MKKLPLTRGKVALVDDEDYADLTKYKWCAYPHRNTWYAMRMAGSKKILLHRYVMGASPGQQVDHRDRDGLNNQRANLRVATSQQNQRNRRKQDGCSSVFKGVCQVGPNRWAASIRDGERTKSGRARSRHLGRFDTQVEAAMAYDRAASKSFGEFAALNFPRVEKDA